MVAMASFKVLPIDERINRHVRTTLTDPIYNYPVQVTVVTTDDQYGPCRSCLNFTRAGERRILFLYNPFTPEEQTSEFAGPVFIHDGLCENYAAGSVFPESIRALPIVLKGYDAHNHLVADEIPEEQSAEEAIEKLFQRPEVVFILVRNTSAKCFIMRIQRA